MLLIREAPHVPSPKEFDMAQWTLSHRADLPARLIADRHYNRQKVGSRQFVPPGRCLVLLADDHSALWVTSWPFAQYVKHAWAGAWINSCFRNEGSNKASDLIRMAVSHTSSIWDAPDLGMVTFVDPSKVRPTKVRGSTIYGYCYMKARFRHVGFTKAGLWAWQMLPQDMPDPIAIPSPLPQTVSCGTQRTL